MKKNLSFIIFSFVILLLAAFLSILVAKKYSALGGRNRIHNRLTRPSPITIDQIQGWMTFDYINHSFKIPADYLQKKFSIVSGKYPYITIQSVVSEKNVSLESFVSSIREAVEESLQSGSRGQN